MEPSKIRLLSSLVNRIADLDDRKGRLEEDERYYKVTGEHELTYDERLKIQKLGNVSDQQFKDTLKMIRMVATELEKEL